MGQDGEDGEGGDVGVSDAAEDGRRRPFDEEIREAVAYEKGLFVKALLVLALVALVVVLRSLFFV